jgi:hypothetical protein
MLLKMFQYVGVSISYLCLSDYTRVPKNHRDGQGQAAVPTAPVQKSWGHASPANRRDMARPCPGASHALSDRGEPCPYGSLICIGLHVKQYDYRLLDGHKCWAIGVFFCRELLKWIH